MQIFLHKNDSIIKSAIDFHRLSPATFTV
ncbi:uncharacterized protein METZ01_LOCUS50579 [marine metagenome]|uniref:Uncharacterized protein n=1 Tax=marine metagenome TaxID=408172 RepID=A0A381S0T3_9ZZZZ